jgi:ribosome biogenesis GTPase
VAPKYRGDSEDWLDDEGQSGQKAAKPAKATPIAASEANATVAEVYPKLCRAVLDGTGESVSCQYRRAAVFGEKKERAPVAVGDRVRVAPLGPGEERIEGLCARANRIVRPAPDRDEGLVHVIAANVDVLAVVAAAEDPRFSPGLVDRFLVAAAAQKIPAIVCVNKIDLAGDVRPWETYRSIGIEVAEVSARFSRGLELLRRRLAGRTVVFCGHSGVGKTSLLAALLGESAGATGDVSAATGKGRHTTTSAVLLGGPGKARWIDTPGVREFGLVGVEPAGLAAYFPDLTGRGCADPACRHAGEPGCAAVGLPRHASYLRIYESLLAGER